jgi:single-strand DNA-binding protein
MIVNVKGRLGADSELKTSKNGNKYVTMRIAENTYVNGENVTNWFRVTWIGDRANRMQEHMKKGSFVDVWGELRISSYDNKNGEKAISLDIMADRVDFISSGSGSTQTNEATTETGTLKRQEEKVASVAATQEVKNDPTDDLPF